MITSIFWIIPLASVLALAFAWFFFRQMMKESEGTELMKKIASVIKKIARYKRIMGLRFKAISPFIKNYHIHGNTSNISCQWRVCLRRSGSTERAYHNAYNDYLKIKLDFSTEKKQNNASLLYNKK